MADPVSDSERLKTALRWLESHHRRLGIQRKSLQHQLAAVEAELDRISREIEAAADRLRNLERP